MVWYTLQRGRSDYMPAIEEELQALKGALSLLQSQHISDIRQLGERIDALQRQIDEQKRSLFEQEQFLHQGFSRLEQQVKQQTDAIRDKFETSDHFATRTWGVVYKQDGNINDIKQDTGILKEQITEVRQDIHGLDEKFDSLEKLLLSRLPPA